MVRARNRNRNPLWNLNLTEPVAAAKPESEPKVGAKAGAPGNVVASRSDQHAAGRGRGGSPGRDEQPARGGGVARTSTRGARPRRYASARAKLDEARVRFPESRLGQERDALDVRCEVSRVTARARHRWRVPSSSATPTAPCAQGWSQSRALPRKCDESGSPVDGDCLLRVAQASACATLAEGPPRRRDPIEQRGDEWWD